MPSLARYAWLSVAAALVTMGLKGSAAWLTGSLGLLSDALESFVNLGAALVALYTLGVAAREPDEKHPFDHSDADYFSAALEGTRRSSARPLHRRAPKGGETWAPKWHGRRSTSRPPP